MRRILLRELKPYSLAELARICGSTEEEVRPAIEQLIGRGIVKLKAETSDNPDELLDVSDALPDEMYQFAYVGLAIVNGFVFVCYPKYIQRKSGPTEAELSQMLAVIRKQSRSDVMLSSRSDARSVDDKLAVLIRLMELYDEYGVYSSYEETRELNGSGEIDWVRTVNAHLPVFFNKKPVYVDCETRRTRRDESDFVMRLHRAVITECSRILRECQLSDILGFDEIVISGEKPSDLGDEGALRWRIEREANVQFVTWKQQALELMGHFLTDCKSSSAYDTVQCFGTNSYYHLWEVACKAVFGDLLGHRLDDLGVAINPNWQACKGDTLLDIIPHPRWQRVDDAGCHDCGDTSTLIPDIVSFETLGDGARAFCILDAKYYVPTERGRMSGQPGVESVTKQFLYQSAYRGFVLDHGFDTVINAFLVPGEREGAAFLGRASFPGVFAAEEPPFSNYVDMLMLPASTVFDAYLQDKRVDNLLLGLVVGQSTCKM